MFSKLLIIVKFVAISLSFIFYSVTAVAMEEIPEGFEELFTQRENTLNVQLSADKNNNFNAQFMTSGDHVKLIGDKNNFTSELTLTWGVEEKISQEITQSLISGVDSSFSCVGFRVECGLVPNKYDFVYVPEQELIIVHINSKYLKERKKKEEEKFVSQESDENAVIIHHGLNVSGSMRNESSDSDINYSYSHENYIGFGSSGYIYNDLNYNENNGLSSDETSYNYVFDTMRLSAGYKYQERSWNSTSFLDNNSMMSGYMLSVGSTRELVKNKSVTNRRVYLNIPSDGRLEITDDRGRVLLSRNVKMGQDYFDYSELPTGTYNVSIRVYDGSQEFYNEERLIVNSASDNLSQGEIDYQITAGLLSRDLTNTNDDDSGDTLSIDSAYEHYDSPFFTNAKVATKLTDYLKVGAGSLITSQDNYTYLGGEIQVAEFSHLSLVSGRFNDGAEFTNIDFSLDSLGISYTSYKASDDIYFGNEDIRLSRLLYGASEYSSLSLNYNHYFTPDLSGYISGVSTKNTTEGMMEESESWSARTGLRLSSLPLGSKVNMELSVNESSTRNIGANVTVSVPLAEQTTYSHATNITSNDSDNSISNRDIVSTSLYEGGDLSVSSTAGLYYEDSDTDSNLVDLSISANYQNDQLNVNSYAYLDSNGDATVSGYMSTSNIITKDGLEFTKDKSPSYFLAENTTGKLESDGKFLAVIDSKVNDEGGMSYLNSNDISVHSLKEYKEYQFEVDTEASDFYNNGDSYKKASSYPGTVIRLKTSFGELKSFISTFSDINGNPVDKVECIGSGCVSSEMLVEGVYQIKVKDEMPYKIISKSQQCVIPELSTAKHLNLGDNFCMPSFEETMDGYHLAIIGRKFYYYLGQYYDDQVIEEYEKKLNNLDVGLIKKKVGKHTYVFAESETLITAMHRPFIDKLLTYAVNSELTPYASN